MGPLSLTRSPWSQGTAPMVRCGICSGPVSFQRCFPTTRCCQSHGIIWNILAVSLGCAVMSGELMDGEGKEAFFPYLQLDFLILGLTIMYTGHWGWNAASAPLVLFRLRSEVCNLRTPVLLCQLEAGRQQEGAQICVSMALVFSW